MSLADGDLLAVGVDHEDGVGDALHVTDAVEVELQLGQLLAQQDLLLLRQQRHTAVGLHGLQLLHAGDAGADGHEVGEHAAEPTGVDVGHAATVGGVGDGLLGLLLRADEQDGAAVLGDVGDEGVSLVHAHEGLLEVQDVDVTAGAEDERLHLGVPTTLLVTEVRACIEQGLDADLSHDTLHSLVLCVRSSPFTRNRFRPLAGRVAHACVIKQPSDYNNAPGRLQRGRRCSSMFSRNADG